MPDHRKAAHPSGIPPRIRGQHQIAEQNPGGSRNTPAYTGTTGPELKTRHPNKEYPRVHGDNVAIMQDFQTSEGIPPRTRGQQCLPFNGLSAAGNTPAYTGTTSGGVPSTTSRGEYPRVHGDNSSVYLNNLHTAGIPPRTRGQPFAVEYILSPDRLGIPCVYVDSGLGAYLEFSGVQVRF